MPSVLDQLRDKATEELTKATKDGKWFDESVEELDKFMARGPSQVQGARVQVTTYLKEHKEKIVGLGLTGVQYITSMLSLRTGSAERDAYTFYLQEVAGFKERLDARREARRATSAKMREINDAWKNAREVLKGLLKILGDYAVPMLLALGSRK